MMSHQKEMNMLKQTAFLLAILGMPACSLHPESQNSVHDITQGAIKNVGGFFSCVGSSTDKIPAKKVPETAVW